MAERSRLFDIPPPPPEFRLREQEENTYLLHATALALQQLGLEPPDSVSAAGLVGITIAANEVRQKELGHDKPVSVSLVSEHARQHARTTSISHLRPTIYSPLDVTTRIQRLGVNGLVKITDGMTYQRHKPKATQWVEATPAGITVVRSQLELARDKVS